MGSMSEWLEFVERKIGTALMLEDGECNGSYPDACVLLSALLSGMASELWPGEKIDRARFVELWVRFSDSNLRPTLISVPLLRRFLCGAGRSADMKLIEQTRRDMFGLGHGTLVLRGDEVDMTEDQLLALGNTLTRKELRPYSYPAVFYKHVRSNLVHEYKLSGDAASHFATRLPANVSYVNRHDASEEELSRRLIHFHIQWLSEITRSIASNIATLMNSFQTLPPPAKWWVHF